MDNSGRHPVEPFNWQTIELPLIVVQTEGRVIFKNELFQLRFGNSIKTLSDFTELVQIIDEYPKKYKIEDFILAAQQKGAINASFKHNPVRINLVFDGCYLLIFLTDRKISAEKASKVPAKSSDLTEVIREFDNIIMQRDEHIARLYSSEKYYRQIVEAAKVVIVRFDKQFIITDFGGSAEKVFGFKKKDVIGRCLFDTIVPEFESSGRDLTGMMDQMLSEIQDFKYNINENITSRGKRIWMQWYNSQITDDSGELIDILSIGIEITDKIRSGKALKESEERFRTLSDLTFEGILIHDKGTILDINLSLAKQVGYSRRELVGQNLFSILIPQEYQHEMLENIRKNMAHYESVVRHKSGTLIPIAVEGRTIKLYDKTVRVAAIRNISELKKMIDELKVSENQSSVIFESAPVIMLLVNERKEIIRINETGKKSLLVKKKSDRNLSLHLKLDDVLINYGINERDEECILRRTLHETFQNNRNVYQVEGSMVRNKRNRREISYFQVSSIIVETLKPKTTLIVMDDITEHRKIVQKLDKHQHHLEEMVDKRTRELWKKSKELVRQNDMLEFERNQLRTLIDNLPDLIYIKDSHSRFVNANKQLVNVMGAKKLEELIGKTDFEFFPEILASEFFNDEKRIFETGRPLIAKEEPGLDINKNPRYILTTKVPLTDLDGKIKYIVGIGRDITEKKIVENKLKEQAGNLKNINKLLESRNSEISKLNNKLKTYNEKLGFANSELTEQKEELLTTLEKLKLTQTQLIQSEKLASLGILSSGIAHEINNPVNFVYAGVNSVMKDMEDIIPVVEELKKLNSNTVDLIIIADKIEKLKEDHQFDEAFEAINSTLKDIKLGASRIIQIVAGLSKYSRSSREDLQAADIHDEIEAVLVLLKNKYKNKIEVIKNYAPKLPAIECSPGKLNQAIMNILNNAIDAIGQNGKIIITTKYLKEKISISVKDTGKGMTDEERTKIFDPFFTTKEVGKGLGLGLYITYTIIEDHKGTIHVNSAMNQGSEFIITLPVKREVAS
jgi:PAS domain S-box-containing protein